MPFWQANRSFLLKAGGALALTLIGFSMVMGMYGSARSKNRQNSDIVSEIELLSEDLGVDEAVELGRQDVLVRRWNEVKAQVTHSPRPRFTFQDEEKEVRLIESISTVGGEWKEKFEKQDLAFDDTVQSLGKLQLAARDDVDERIARLDMLDRILAAVYETDLSALGGIRHEQREIVSVPGSELAILRLPIRIEVEGVYGEVAALIRRIQEAGEFVRVGEASLKPGLEAFVKAEIRVAALQVVEGSSAEDDGGGDRGGGHRPRRRR